MAENSLWHKQVVENESKNFNNFSRYTHLIGNVKFTNMVVYRMRGNRSSLKLGEIEQMRVYNKNKRH